MINLINLPILINSLQKKKQYNYHKIDLLQILQKKRTGFIDYSNFSYCSICELTKPKEMIRCDTCGRLVRHKPNNKQAGYWKKELKYIE